jgi:uncharacterized repeat protein (TIGR03803 family)
MRIRWTALLTTLILTTLPLITANAQTYTDLHDFNCAVEGCDPTYVSLLAQGQDGNIYGTASFGPGTSGDGTVLKMTLDGTVTTIQSFDGTNGSTPYGGLVLGPDGNFYGTTTSGTNNAGTIFKVTPAGVLTTLYAFPLNTMDSGAAPMTAPTLGNDGNYYGLTGVGEGTASGVAYRYSPTVVYTPLTTLTEALPGSGFFAPLIQGLDGNFYSTTYASVTGSAGTVYRMSPAGVISIVYSFNSNAAYGGWGYAPLVEDFEGNFYGTEAEGGKFNGGVVFKVTGSGKITRLHNFTDYCALESYGCTPAGGLVLGSDGNLYGSTVHGGPDNDGVLFKITKSGVYTKLFSFDGADGAATESTAMQHTNGKIYGICMNGGAYGGGVLYSLDLGLPPFVALLFNAGQAGTSIGILGQGFEGTKEVLFHGVSASFTVVSDTYLTAIVPSAATTGFVTVKTPTGVLKSSRKFVVQP